MSKCLLYAPAAVVVAALALACCGRPMPLGVLASGGVAAGAWRAVVEFMKEEGL